MFVSHVLGHKTKSKSVQTTMIKSLEIERTQTVSQIQNIFTKNLETIR